MTCLTFGLARYRHVDETWQFLAVPGAIVYFLDNQLYVNARRYVCGEDYGTVSSTLKQELRLEEEKLQDLKENLTRLEKEMFKRLWEMQRAAGALE